MRRTLTTTAIALLTGATMLAAQEANQQPPDQVYVAYYKIGYADLDEWIEDYYEFSVPVLEELQAEGVIVGWGAWQHQTGVEYNWRFAVRTTEWAQLSEFWSEYLSRVQQRSPEAMARGSAMILAHFDEIWNLTEVHVPEGMTAEYMYDSRFQIAFGDFGAWNALWRDVVAPELDRAMEDGVLSGWAVQEHNTGGRYNWKMLYFFEAWDDMDDLFGRVMSGLRTDAELWDRFGSMIQAHDDVIWTSVSDPERM
jgi:hypothetical protein